jgi:hypothetical protein
MDFQELIFTNYCHLTFYIKLSKAPSKTTSLHGWAYIEEVDSPADAKQILVDIDHR